MRDVFEKKKQFFFSFVIKCCCCFYYIFVVCFQSLATGIKNIMNKKRARETKAGKKKNTF